MSKDGDSDILQVVDAASEDSTESGAHAPARIESFAGRWWVLHTKSRNEKAVSVELAHSKIDHFLPLVTRKRVYGSRVRRVELPLFPGYVFLCGGDADRVAALRTRRIANVLEVSDQERFKTDLVQIQRVVESSEQIGLYPKLKEGARCRVIGGGLIGIEGIVLKRRGPWRVYVGVQFLGQSAELEIDSDLLEVLD